MSDRQHRGPAHAGPAAPATGELGRRLTGVRPAPFEVELERARDRGSIAGYRALADRDLDADLELAELADRLERHGPADAAFESTTLAQQIIDGRTP